MLRRGFKLGGMVFLFLTFLAAHAGADQVRQVKPASVGWTGVTVKTELAVSILKTLGYKAKNLTLSVPISYMALSKGDVDIFWGNWMPSRTNIEETFTPPGRFKLAAPAPYKGWFKTGSPSRANRL